MARLFESLVAGLVAACLTVGLAGPAYSKKPQTPVNPGPQPDFTQASAEAERLIRSSLFDPGSAEFQWPFAWVGGFWKPFLGSRKVGWWTCGRVNAKNRMGGYVGFQNFVVVVNEGRIIHHEVGTGRQFDLTNGQCQQALKKGTLQAATASPSDLASMIAANKPVLGIEMLPVPDGVYLRSVAPGSPAATAGLQPGMVVSHINGIALKGLSESSLAQIAAGAEGEIALTVIGRGVVKLTRAAVSVQQ
jgi:membrane-associated protease RseP (regulator of RpoE activity)